MSSICSFQTGDSVLPLLCLCVPLCSGRVGSVGATSGRDLGRALPACVSYLLVFDTKSVLTRVLHECVLWELPRDTPVLDRHLRLLLLPAGALLQAAVAYFSVIVALRT